MAQSVGQQGLEGVGRGSNPSLYLHFLTLLKRRKIVIPPFMHQKFRDQNFSQTRKGSLTKVFGTVRQKNFVKIVIPYYSKSKKFFNTKAFLKHKGPPYEYFPYCETKKFSK